MRSTRLLCVYSFALLFIKQADAQSPADTTLTSDSLTQAAKVYTTSAAARDRLYNGPLYEGYDHHPDGHPFFMADTPLAGSVTCDGVLFADVRLSYDLLKDAVVMRNAQKDITFKLLPEKIARFMAAQHSFVYLTADSNTVAVPATGYYEELYQGKVTALARHEKKIQSSGRAEENLAHFQQYDYYFLIIAGRYHRVHSQSELLDAFGPDKSRIRDFIKTAHLNFRKDPVTTLRSVSDYYSTLKN